MFLQHCSRNNVSSFAGAISLTYFRINEIALRASLIFDSNGHHILSTSSYLLMLLLKFNFFYYFVS